MTTCIEQLFLNPQVGNIFGILGSMQSIRPKIFALQPHLATETI